MLVLRELGLGDRDVLIVAALFQSTNCPGVPSAYAKTVSEKD